MVECSLISGYMPWLKQLSGTWLGRRKAVFPEKSSMVNSLKRSFKSPRVSWLEPFNSLLATWREHRKIFILPWWNGLQERKQGLLNFESEASIVVQSLSNWKIFLEVGKDQGRQYIGTELGNFLDRFIAVMILQRPILEVKCFHRRPWNTWLSSMIHFPILGKVVQILIFPLNSSEDIIRISSSCSKVQLNWSSTNASTKNSL